MGMVEPSAGIAEVDELRMAVAGLEARLDRFTAFLDSAAYGLMTIERGLVIGSQFSRSLSGLLGVEAERIADAPFIDLMTEQFWLSGEKCSLMAHALDVAFESDRLSWDINVDHLPREFVRKDARSVTVEALWTPLLCPESDLVQSVVLSLRDVTEERMRQARLREAEQAQEAQLAHLAMLLRRPRDQLAVFFAEAEHRFRTLHVALSSRIANPEFIAAELHTLKGSVALIGFSEISEALHRLEETLPTANATGAAVLDRQDALSLWRRATGAYNGLRDVYHEVLRGVKTVPTTLGSIAEPHLASARARLSEIGVDAHLRIDDCLGEMPVDMAKAFSTALQHVVINMVDHSILPARIEDGRLHSRLSIEGRWAIDSSECTALVRLVDDGYGFDRAGLYARARAAGFSAAEAERLDIVFTPGFSTAERVGLRSGRGIGMSAARQAITAIGGAITLDNQVEGGSQIEIRAPARF